MLLSSPDQISGCDERPMLYACLTTPGVCATQAPLFQKSTGSCSIREMMRLNTCAIDAQKWDVHLPAHVDYQAVRPEYVPQCQMWQKQLLLAAPNINVLSLGPHVSRAPALGNLPLRHLELVIEKEQPWLVGFLQDLRHVTTLESLTVLSQASQGAVPNLRLRSSLKNLRHIRLQNLLPTQEFSLPEDCLLHLKAHYYSPQWSQGIARHTAVIDLRPFSLSAWPADIWYFSKLQCLMMEMPSMQLTKSDSVRNLDVGELQHIPHVRLINCGGGRVKCSAGSWQSLDIRGIGCLVFTDINAFLRGTKAFTFDFISRDGEAEAVSASGVVRSACQKNDVQYFDCSATAVSTSEQAVQAYTKHADKLCRCTTGAIRELEYCPVLRSACLWAAGTFWPKDPCTALF